MRACVVVLFALLFVLAACGPEDSKECLLATSTECAVGFPPTYANIFQQSLRSTCGGPGVSCHGIDGAKAGLTFADEQNSYDLLLGNAGAGNVTKARVIPGDPDASLLVQRIECGSPQPRMPLNSDPLPATVRCAIVKWIADGAPR